MDHSMAKTVLVTGASGFVGGSVLHHAPADWTMYTCSAARSRNRAPT